jgi:CRP-like cAMP-binding protein
VLWQPTQRKLSPVLLKKLRGLRRVQQFASGETLFGQGSTVRGIYLVDSGEARLLLTTAGCERQLVEVAAPGTILGLSESMGGGENYRVTAQAGGLTTAVFIPRSEFRAFMRQHHDFCMQIIKLLAEDLNGLYYRFRSISAHPGRPRQRALNEQLD